MLMEVCVRNIEKFNVCTGFIFGKLYGEFPIWRKLEPNALVAEMKGAITDDEEKKINAATFVVNTLDWLVATGYLMMVEGNTKASNRYVLSPKAFEALNATLSALEGKKASVEEKSVGEVLSEAAENAGKDLAKETWKQVSSEIVGQVIGYAAKAFAS